MKVHQFAGTTYFYDAASPPGPSPGGSQLSSAASSAGPSHHHPHQHHHPAQQEVTYGDPSAAYYGSADPSTQGYPYAQPGAQAEGYEDPRMYQHHHAHHLQHPHAHPHHQQHPQHHQHNPYGPPSGGYPGYSSSSSGPPVSGSGGPRSVSPYGGGGLPPQAQPPNPHHSAQHHHHQQPQQPSQHSASSMMTGAVVVPPPQLMAPTPYRKAHQFFMSESLRQNLLRKDGLMCPSVIENPNAGGRTKAAPPRVGPHYHTLRLIDGDSAAPRTQFHARARLQSLFSEVQSEVYKCTSAANGSVVVLRRIITPKLSGELESPQHQAVVNAWRQFRHPNAVPVRDVSLSSDWSGTKPDGSRDLVFEYEFIPGAVTYEQAFLPPHTPVGSPPAVSEPDLWSLICQLVSALRAIHAAGLCCRGALTPSKLLVAPGNRVYINCLGILDVLFPQTNNMPVGQMQYNDLLALNELLVATACGNTRHFSPEILKQQGHYSAALIQFIDTLAAAPSVFDLLPYLSDRFVEEADSRMVLMDTLENELRKELHNGRLFRIVTKLGFINERPEYENDPSWSETGDRYILKLFRDYLFHQTDEKAEARVDWGHVCSALNKLDAGSEERLMLSSRDGNNLLVVSYRDVRRLVDDCFNELLVKGSSGPALPPATSLEGGMAALALDSASHMGMSAIQPNGFPAL